MSGIESVGSSSAVHEAGHIEDTAPTSGASGTSHAASNEVGDFGEAAQSHGADAPFDLFKALGELFSGGAQNGNANAFDLGTLLASIFDFAGQGDGDGKIQLAGQEISGGSSSKAGDGADVTGERIFNPGPPPRAKSGPDNPNLREDHVGVRKEVEVSGETGDENFKVKGRAKAEAHAEANSYSETYGDGKNVHARVGADASVGASAEVEGSIKTKVAELDGKATISAEANARAQAEAHAGMDGIGASAQAEHGVMAKSTNSTNLKVANGLIEGHGDAHAEAGAGGVATAKTEFSYNPPTAVAHGKAEAFAGARAGFVAKGGMGGVQGGVGVEVWAGAGAKIEGSAALKDGKLKLDFTIGAAVAVGFKINLVVEIDLKKAAKTFGDILTFMGGGGIFAAVGKLFGGGKGDGSQANSAITDAVKQAGPMVKQFMKKADAPEKSDAANDTEREESVHDEEEVDAPAHDEGAELPTHDSHTSEA